MTARLPFSRFHKVVPALFSGTEIIRYRGVRIAVNPGDVLGYYAYFLNDYANSEIDELIQHCQNARLMVDVGANFGWLSLAVAHSCPNLQVLAFEPSEEIASTMRQNLALNPCLNSRIRLVQKAVGSSDGMAEFVPSRHAHNPGVGRVCFSKQTQSLNPVEVTRLDSYFHGAVKPDVVKIDVEGAELDVLLGMSDLFAQGYPRAVLVETHGFYYPRGVEEFNAAVVAALHSGGFRVYMHHKKRWTLLDRPLGWKARAHLLAAR